MLAHNLAFEIAPIQVRSLTNLAYRLLVCSESHIRRIHTIS